MNGVAAEVTKEIGVLLEHDDVDAGARQQEAQHEPAGPAADDAATGGKSSGHGYRSRPTMTTPLKHRLWLQRSQVGGRREQIIRAELGDGRSHQRSPQSAPIAAL